MNRLLLTLSFAAALLLPGCAANPRDAQSAEPVSKLLDGPLDTVSTITLYGWGDEKPIDDVFEMLRDIDRRMSAVSPDSELSSISARSGVPVTVSQDTYALIAYAKKISAETGGAFDITVSPIVALWGIGTENERVPAQPEIDAALPCVGYEGVALDEAARSVTLEKPGMKLDLGGIAKGYACDKAVEILRNAGVKHAIVDLGGNIFTLGAKPDGSMWKVGVKSPLAGENGHFCAVSVADRTVVTSGVYERYFESGGRAYHHIMDPKTGCPISNGLISVTIICESSTQADALSTACFVLGAERGMEYLSSLPDVQGIFVTDDLNVYITPGLSDTFHITDERFELVTLP